MTLSILLAQPDCALGDPQGNGEKIAAAAADAHARGAHVLLLPELALCGGHCQDLFLRPGFLDACDAAVQHLAQASSQWPGLTLVLGHPWRREGQLHNAASVLRDGRVCSSHAARSMDAALAPWLSPGPAGAPLELPDGGRMALCVGMMDAPGELPQDTRALAVLDGAPFSGPQALGAREEKLAALARAHALPLFCARAVGAHDAVVLDGHSCAFGADGTLAARAQGFVADALAVALEAAGRVQGHIAPLPGREALLWSALVLALGQYVRQNGFAGVVLGLSGGMDSALVLALAVDALGPERVRSVMLPSAYTADISIIDARQMAARLRVRHENLPITPLFEGFGAALDPVLAGREPDSTEENLQARIRATLLMALSNKLGLLLLSTGNKSESAVGYSTLYGDMAGGFAPIQDLFKTEVYELARWRNAHTPAGGVASPIPERIITRAPSAELRPDQTDQDSLPPYEVLDAIVRLRMEEQLEAAHIAARLADQGPGVDAQTVTRVLKLMRASEHKRHQAPPGPRLGPRSFADNWHQPVRHGFAA